MVNVLPIAHEMTDPPLIINALEASKECINQMKAKSTCVEVPAAGMRRSSRLRGDITLTTQEKNDAMTKKRNLEGNTSTHPSISELSNSSLNDISAKIGVKIDNACSNSFDILREIENVRLNLYAKQQKNKSNVKISECTDHDEPSMAPQIEWHPEESSEPDDFELVLSRKKRREIKKRINISPVLTKGKRTQEAPGSPKK